MKTSSVISIMGLLFLGYFIGSVREHQQQQAREQEIAMQLNPVTGGSEEFLLVKSADENSPILLRQRRITIGGQTFHIAVAELKPEGVAMYPHTANYGLYVTPSKKTAVGEYIMGTQ